jgi:hypothetical protein
MKLRKGFTRKSLVLIQILVIFLFAVRLQADECDEDLVQEAIADSKTTIAQFEGILKKCSGNNSLRFAYAKKLKDSAPEQAIAVLKKAYDNEFRDTELQAAMGSLLASIYEEKGDFFNAYAWYKKISTLANVKTKDEHYQAAQDIQKKIKEKIQLSIKDFDSIENIILPENYLYKNDWEKISETIQVYSALYQNIKQEFDELNEKYCNTDKYNLINNLLTKIEKKGTSSNKLNVKKAQLNFFKEYHLGNLSYEGKKWSAAKVHYQNALKLRNDETIKKRLVTVNTKNMFYTLLDEVKKKENDYIDSDSYTYPVNKTNSINEAYLDTEEKKILSFLIGSHQGILTKNIEMVTSACNLWIKNKQLFINNNKDYLFIVKPVINSVLANHFDSIDSSFAILNLAANKKERKWSDMVDQTISYAAGVLRAVYIIIQDTGCKEYISSNNEGRLKELKGKQKQFASFKNYYDEGYDYNKSGDYASAIDSFASAIGIANNISGLTIRYRAEELKNLAQNRQTQAQVGNRNALFEKCIAKVNELKNSKRSLNGLILAWGILTGKETFQPLPSFSNYSNTIQMPAHLEKDEITKVEEIEQELAYAILQNSLKLMNEKKFSEALIGFKVMVTKGYTTVEDHPNFIQNLVDLTECLQKYDQTPDGCGVAIDDFKDQDTNKIYFSQIESMLSEYRRESVTISFSVQGGKRTCRPEYHEYINKYKFEDALKILNKSDNCVTGSGQEGQREKKILLVALYEDWAIFLKHNGKPEKALEKYNALFLTDPEKMQSDAIKNLIMQIFDEYPALKNDSNIKTYGFAAQYIQNDSAKKNLSFKNQKIDGIDGLEDQLCGEYLLFKTALSSWRNPKILVSDKKIHTLLKEGIQQLKSCTVYDTKDRCRSGLHQFLRYGDQMVWKGILPALTRKGVVRKRNGKYSDTFNEPSKARFIFYYFIAERNLDLCNFDTAFNILKNLHDYFRLTPTMNKLLQLKKSEVKKLKWQVS